MPIIKRLTSLARRFRFSLGLGPRNIAECSAYLRFMAQRSADQPVPLKMPWGEFHCAHVGVARSQFEEIFVRRQYAFKTASPVPTIVDCGGNIGLSAIWFMQNYPGCRLTVYEADPEIAGVLQRNLTAAGYGDNKVLNRAVWIAEQEVSFAETGIDTGKIDPQGGRRVKSIDLAAVLPDQVDLLKMDIEGAEFEVLERLLDSGAASKVSNIAVEFHPSRSTFLAMLNIFRRMHDSGFNISFESFFGPYCGPEGTASVFETVGRNRMFVQAYAWRG